MPLQILLIDDHQIMREGLRSLLDRDPTVQVVGEAADGRSGLELVERLRPDVAVFDNAMPEMTGIEAIRRLRAGGYPGGLIILSSYHEARTISQAREVGADCYLNKESAFQLLRTAIDRAHRRQWFLGPDLAELEPGAAPLSPGWLLTPREREVLQALAQGQSTKEIAFSLELSPKTVETHRMHLMSKLQVTNLADLTRLAIREGYVSL
jgi:DNA-binding NarL/FixJ family response regulator